MKKILILALIAVMMTVLMLPAAADSAVRIDMQPQNPTYPEYATATYYVSAVGSNLHCTWYLEYEGKTYNLSDNTNGIEPWEAYAGESYGGYRDGNTFTWFFGGIEEGLDGAQIWCVIEDGHYDVTSERAMVTVQGDAMPPQILSMPAEVTVYRGDRPEVRCLANSTDGSQLEYTWYETSTGRLQDIRAIIPEENGDTFYPSTEMPGVRYYVCGIETSKGGRAYSSVLPVTVLDSDPEYGPEMEILTTSLPDAVVGKAYKAELKCNDPYGLFTLYYNPGGANQLEESGLRLTKENFIMGTPKKAGTFTFTVCASGDYGEDYLEYTITVKKEVPEATEPTEPAATDPKATEPAESKPTDPEATEPDESKETKPTEKPENDEDEDDTRTTGSKKNRSDKDDEEFPWWGFVLIGLGSCLAGVGVAFLLLKKKR